MVVRAGEKGPGKLARQPLLLFSVLFLAVLEVCASLLDKIGNKKAQLDPAHAGSVPLRLPYAAL